VVVGTPGNAFSLPATAAMLDLLQATAQRYAS
jgi:hypothetical protein